MDSTSNGCVVKGGGNDNALGVVAFYVDSTSQKPTWPEEKNSAGTVPKGAENVSKNIVALTKDEKNIVAGHLAKSIEGGKIYSIARRSFGASCGVCRMGFT